MQEYPLLACASAGCDILPSRRAASLRPCVRRVASVSVVARWLAARGCDMMTSLSTGVFFVVRGIPQKRFAKLADRRTKGKPSTCEVAPEQQSDVAPCWKEGVGWAMSFGSGQAGVVEAVLVVVGHGGEGTVGS